MGDANKNVNAKAAKKIGKLVSPGVISAEIALLFYAFAKANIADGFVIAATAYSLMIVVMAYIANAKS